MLLLIDNYDSFTFNLHQLVATVARLERPGLEIHIVRNDQITPEQALALSPTHLVISPGPCTPRQAGVSVSLVRAAAERQIPLLGVCLGHQCIAEAFGGVVERAGQVVHGKTGQIQHDGRGVFQGLPSPLVVARYHSLIVRAGSLDPAELEANAWTAEGQIMALRHRRLPIHGVQFHPESFLSEHGAALVGNFLRMSRGATQPREWDGCITAAVPARAQPCDAPGAPGPAAAAAGGRR